MNRAITVAGFVAALIGVGLLSGSVTPIAYGASEANAQTVGSGLFGGLLTLGGGITSLWQLFKGQLGGGTTSDLLKKVEDLAGNIIGKPQTVETVTAEIALVALFTICAKNGDTVNLAAVSALANSMLGKKP